MHDPMVVAFEVKLPFPERQKFYERAEKKRWTWGRRRFTNPEHLGQPIYKWWRPCGYEPRVAGRVYRWRSFLTVWHVEPKGHDSGTICKHTKRWQEPDGTWHSKPLRAWKWHVHHWHLQWHFGQKLKRFLWARCAKCHYRFPWGYSPVSHQWDGPRDRWFYKTEHSYHHECSAVISYERGVEERDSIIRHLASAYQLSRDLDEREAVERLTGNASPLDFHLRYRLQGILGWQHDDNHELVKTVCAECGEHIFPINAAYHRGDFYYHREHVPATTAR